MVVLLALVTLAVSIGAQEVNLPPFASWTYSGPSGSLWDGPSGSKNIRLGLGGRSALSIQTPAYLDYLGRSVQSYRMTFSHMSWSRYSEGGLAVSKDGIVVASIPFDKYLTSYSLVIQGAGYFPVNIGTERIQLHCGSLQQEGVLGILGESPIAKTARSD
ncbi:MAG: hypothetical protein WCT19_03985 [Candidatus Paceibacterota bacterium]